MTVYTASVYSRAVFFSLWSGQQTGRPWPSSIVNNKSGGIKEKEKTRAACKMNRRKRREERAAALETSNPIDWTNRQPRRDKKEQSIRAVWNQRAKATLKPKMIIKIDFTVVHFFLLLFALPSRGMKRRHFRYSKYTKCLTHSRYVYIPAFFSPHLLSPFILLTSDSMLFDQKVSTFAFCYYSRGIQLTPRGIRVIEARQIAFPVIWISFSDIFRVPGNIF